MKPLGLYIHIPFCRRKCHYCDFVSFPDCEALFDDYIDALIDEARLYGAYLKDHTVDTLFIGGGTPSLLSPVQIEKLTDGLKSACNFKLVEATTEANPETLDEEKISDYAACGINRLSLGLQTHDNGILSDIGRRHTFEQFLYVYEIAGRYFNNINVDTIFGLPGQTTDNFSTTIEHLIGLFPAHVSSYSLKLEPGTKLARRFLGADEDTDREMYHAAAAMLGSAEYTHYETSNFAKPGYECLHNKKYWTGEEYLGLGVAAHSYTAYPFKQRFNNTGDLDIYIQKIKSGEKPVVSMSGLSKNDELTEYIMLRLRLKQGIAFDDFNSRFDMDFKKKFIRPIELSERAKLITCDKRGIYPTLKGFDLQNALIIEFMKII